MYESALTLQTLRPAIAEISLALSICIVLLVDVFAGKARRQLTPALTLVALAACAAMTVNRRSSWSGPASPGAGPGTGPQ